MKQNSGDEQAILKASEIQPSKDSKSSSDSISVDKVGRTFERDVLRIATNRQFAITER